MRRVRFAVLVLSLIALPLGCMAMAGGDASMSSEAAPALGGWDDSTVATGEPMGYRGEKTDALAEVSAETVELDRALSEAQDEDSGGDGGVRSAAEGRKLIRTGSMSVAVDDYGPFQTALEARVEELGGFVADASLSHYAGRVSWATLTIRVPAEGFEDLIGWAESEVEVQSLDIGTQDVTEEWVDVRSRIDNGKRTENRLLLLLDDRTADLEDVLAVERELARVRQEIERAEGRMRVLSDQVSLATLTLSVSVRNPYEPAVDPPGFGQMIADTFHGSIAAMLTVGKGLVLVATAASPWLLLLTVFAYLAYRLLRRLLRRKSA